MSDISLNWGNFFDLVIGVPFLALALLLLVLGFWRRWTRWHLLAGTLSAATAGDLLHSLTYARPADHFLTFLLVGFGAGMLLLSIALAFWIPPRRLPDSK